MKTPENSETVEAQKTEENSKSKVNVPAKEKSKTTLTDRFPVSQNVM